MNEVNPQDYTTAVLFVNLGTPESPTFFGVMQFLRKFLRDPRVVEIPRVLWWCLLEIFILPFRTGKALKLYREIWTPEGSPLQILTERLVNNVALHFKGWETQGNKRKEKIAFFYAMTYGNPSIESRLNTIKLENISRLMVIPLFPQYSSTTTGAVFDKVVLQLKSQRCIPSLYFIHEYSKTDPYVEALAHSVLQSWEREGRTERLLFSFHGIPLQYQQKGDPYPACCVALAHRVAEMLKIPEKNWCFSFQSRFGAGAWCEPYTETVLIKWAGEGVKSVSVISPSFAVECLETLEELNIQLRHCFLNAGGERYHYIPALNDTCAHTRVFTTLIENFFQKNSE